MSDVYADFVRGSANGRKRPHHGSPRRPQSGHEGASLAIVPVSEPSVRPRDPYRARLSPGSGAMVDYIDAEAMAYDSSPLGVGNFTMSVFDRHDAQSAARSGVTFVENKHFEMSPIQCKSLLTCNNEFRQTFPYVYFALVKEVVDVKRLAEREMIIPIRQDLKLKKEMTFAEKAVRNYLSGQLQKALSGRFPCIDLGRRLVDKVIDHLWEEIIDGVRETEHDRTVVQVISRQHIDNELKVNKKFSASLGINAVVAVVEGTIQVEVHRGYMFDLVAPKKIFLNVDIVTKCVFLNGGQLAVLDRDPLFQDQVEIGENRNVHKVVSRSSRW